MRVAFSGSHRVGKSTLVAGVARALSGYTTVDEPYDLLAEEGHEGSEAPSLEDFEAQLERSLVELEAGEADVLFDRCPADFLAYLAVDDPAALEDDERLERARAAMLTLDLVVFVPVEPRDRVALEAHEDKEHRLAVHERLHELLVGDAVGVGVEILIVDGDEDERVAQVMAQIGRMDPR